MNIYTMQGGSVEYGEPKRRTTAFSDIDLRIQEGEFLVLTGPSGSGKTSLINVLAGFQPLTTGTISFKGVDLRTMSERALSDYRVRGIGMVHQFFNLIPELTAEENVMAPLLLGGLRFHQARDRARELLERVNLAHRFRHLPRELSGGEQQRAAVARAIANEPSVLLCDEPTGNLDARNSEAVMQTLAEIHSQGSKTVVLVTHDKQAAAAGTRVVDMASG